MLPAVAKMLFRLPDAAAVTENPDPDELKALAERMPNARPTAFGNVNVQTQVVSRSKASTFIVTDEPDGQNQAITREEGERWAQAQDAYIAKQEMVVVDGYIGNDPEFRTPARLYIEAANANIAGMQQQLYFSPADGEELEPELTVIYTPNLKAEGYPDDRLIAVDLEQGVTRVFNSDYFGESKKGGLRMWNKLVYDRGGIPLHAGCKIIPTEQGKRVGLIVGLSGTGKTTTTFTRQNGSLPVQDDFVAWMPNGRVYATENGCFAKTFGLNPEDEPTIYSAVTQPRSYLENVSQHGDEVDFYDTDYTSNGRATFPFDVIEAASADEIDEAHFLLILNKNENIVPAVAKLEGPQAAAFFMLGETTGTSAGGADEAGKFLRVPGTNPFFPMLHDLQGNRFLELLAQQPARGLRDEHRPRRRPRRRRALAQGADQALVRDRQGHRRGHDRVGAGSGLRLPRRRLGAGDRRAGDPAAPAALRASRAARTSTAPWSSASRPSGPSSCAASRASPTRSSPPSLRRSPLPRRRMRPPMQEQVERFLESPALAERTRRAYRYDVEEFCAWLQGRGTRLEDVDVRALSEYAAELGRARPRKLAPATIGRKLAAVRAFLRHALGARAGAGRLVRTAPPAAAARCASAARGRRRARGVHG